jgi:BirA family transcriptional regulator, biotin operon repressor / biotin---[acetyl-CoA-carboxylase] ligase
MDRPELPWNAAALRQRLEATWPGITVEVVGSTGSTNSDLLARSRTQAGVPCLRVAELQTAGRGRQGRTWHAERGASLTFSLAVPLARPSLAGLSLAVGVILADALDPPRGPSIARLPAVEGASAPRPADRRIGLKWPNDLVIVDGAARTRKLGGILIETLGLDSARLVVLGVGLNLRAMALGLDSPGGLAALDEIDPGVSAPALLERLAGPLGAGLRRFDETGFKAFEPRFAQRDLLAGRAVTTTQAGAREGIADGIGADGSLRLRTPDGALLSISSGEVSVRLATAAQPC